MIYVLVKMIKDYVKIFIKKWKKCPLYDVNAYRGW